MSRAHTLDLKAASKIKALSKRLAALVEELQPDSIGEDIRISLEKLNNIADTSRRLGVAVAQYHGIGATGGKGRLKEYFLRLKNQVVEGCELAVIAGVPTYGRRVRELRGEGMIILSGSSQEGRVKYGLGPDQYIYIE
jgi:hypothetical protein